MEDFREFKLHVSALEIKLEKIIAMDVKDRSEEHTSELQSHSDLVCRLLLEKKKKKTKNKKKKKQKEKKKKKKKKYAQDKS